MKDDRIVDPKDVEVAHRGYFMGVGLHTPNYEDYNYHYGSYKDKDVIVELAPGIFEAAFPFIYVLFPEIVDEIMEEILKLDMDSEENKIYTMEVGEDLFFASNHIPKSLPDSDSKFIMIADHSKCTKDQCMNHAEMKPSEILTQALINEGVDPDNIHPYEEKLDHDERTGN